MNQGGCIWSRTKVGGPGLKMPDSGLLLFFSGNRGFSKSACHPRKRTPLMARHLWSAPLPRA